MLFLRLVERKRYRPMTGATLRQAMLACAFLMAGCTIGNGRICGFQTPTANCKKEVLERLLSGAPLEPPPVEVEQRLIYRSTPQPEGQSRIRIFGQNGVFAELHIGSACIRKGGGQRVSAGLGEALASTLGMTTNTSLGIAETPRSHHVEKMSGPFSAAYFREYVLPSGKPTSLRMGINGFHHAKSGAKRYGSACVRTVSFTPRNMEDYEVDWTVVVGRCELSLNRVVDRDGYVELERVPVADSPDCPMP